MSALLPDLLMPHVFSRQVDGGRAGLSWPLHSRRGPHSRRVAVSGLSRIRLGVLSEDADVRGGLLAVLFGCDKDTVSRRDTILGGREGASSPICPPSGCFWH